MEMNLFPTFANTEQAVEYVQDNFRWALREPLAPGPRPLPSDYHDLYPCFDLGVVTRYAHDSNIPEMVSHANGGLVGGYLEKGSVLRPASLSIKRDDESSLACHILPTSGPLEGEQDSNIPEMVQVIFYAMVVNEVMELGIAWRITARRLMCTLQQLHWDPFELWLKNVE
ncbi:hypothetical protein Cgig2_006585 [Carnegiea gigantea]|uniref:Uncharacterized protein n=1 Tax=Carnegiea gigantea TaxID=171969 RepID=A0A9Q1KQP6_9CARY|nr:hypothetical protein Cgig2_006585 [Carnegiea gigantea]